MTKKELVQDMKRATNGASFMSVMQFAQYRGIHPNTATLKLKGLEYTQEERGHRKYYFVGDIADKILESRKDM